MQRHDGRKPDQLRPVKITPGFLKNVAGSCLVEFGGTRVVCAASLEQGVPPFLKGSGRGWLTAEYSMLPASSSSRIPRERSKLGGRTQEIQRLIGRSLRSCADLSKIGERSILVDCDVIDADGGTRTAAITGAYVATVLALRACPGDLSGSLQSAVAAVSVGLVNRVPVLDLDYSEDNGAGVDMNVVMLKDGKLVEVQGTAETVAFDRATLNAMLDLSEKGIRELFEIQAHALAH